MKLKKLQIQNYKSLVDLEIIEPNPFTVFAGPNGSGKSNIFEAIAFWNALNKRRDDKSSITEVIDDFGGLKNIEPKSGYAKTSSFTMADDHFEDLSDLSFEKISKKSQIIAKNPESDGRDYYFNHDDETITSDYFSQFSSNFLKLFINNPKDNGYKTSGDSRINKNASNLEAVLNRLFEDENKKEDITNWMQLFVPELDEIKIQASSLSGTKEIYFKEKSIDTFIPKSLISDGTYNILCLLAAVYQSDEPQFLCIEEPENGLNPYVVESLVSFFRQQCEEHGHYIWLNTHSQTLVKELQPFELVLVDKVNGETKIKQFDKNYNLYGLEMDTAWLSNALGGGVPW